VHEHPRERVVREVIVETLRRDPRLVHLGLLRLPVAVDTAVSEQLLANAMPRRGPGAPEIIAAAHQVSEPFGLRRRWLHVGQLPAAVKPHELLRVTTVGLDPVTGADRDQRRRDHIARDPELGQQPEQIKPARTGLVTDRQPVRTTEPIDEPTDRRPGRLDLLHLGLSACRWQRRGNNRKLVHVKADPQTHIHGRGRDNVRHGWSPGCMRPWPKVALTPPKLTREPATREGQPPRVHTD